MRDCKVKAHTGSRVYPVKGRVKIIDRHIPNMFSLLRILLSVLLIPLLPIRIVFTVVYIAIGITDLLDGLIARKYGYESDFGAKLDSIADFVF